MFPQISIIIPVYNVEPYIRRCVDSIVSQSYQNWELILVDDGSTDESGTICDEYAEKYNRVSVYHKENGGVSSARNFGLEKACGKWIAFVDADDCVLPGWLEKIAKYVVEQDADIYMWGMQIGNDSRRIIKKVIPEDIFWVNTTAFIESNSYRYNSVVYLFNKEFIEKYNCKFPTGIKLSEDQCFILMYLCHNPRIITIPEIYYYYIHNSKSAVSIYVSTNNYADNLIVARLFADYSVQYEAVEKKFIQKAVNGLFRDFLKCVASQDKNLSEESVQKIYRECYDAIKKRYPFTLNDLEFKVARYDVLWGVFYWNHKNGVKEWLKMCN